MTVSLALIGIVAALVVALQSYFALKYRKPFFIVFIALVATSQIATHVIQAYNRYVSIEEEKKKRDRELAFSLWAYTDNKLGNIRPLKELTKNYPFLVGYYLFKHAQTEDSQAKFQESIEKKELVAPSYYLLGAIEMQNTRIAKAIEYFNKAIKSDDRYSPSYYALGRAQILSGDKENGLRNLFKAVELSVVHCVNFKYRYDEKNPGEWKAVQNEKEFGKLVEKCRAIKHLI